MTEGVLRIALLADGASDRALVPILLWTLRQIDASLSVAQPGFLSRNARPLAEGMRAATELFDPDLLFVHHDAEAQDPDTRREEIPDIDRKVVRVVPVRMTEAWLLIGEAAIRSAAGRPSGRERLEMPAVGRLEGLPDPKAVLHDLLVVAAAVSGRRRKRFQQDLPAIVQRVADLIEDYAPLRRLSAFRRFEQDCRQALGAL